MADEADGIHDREAAHEHDDVDGREGAHAQDESDTQDETDGHDEEAARRRRCETIIHASSAVAAAAATGTFVPGADSVAIMPVQVAMVAALANEHGIAPSSSIVKSVVYASLGSIVGKAGAGVLLRWVPVAGNLVRASVALSVTEALGHMVLERLEKGEGLA